jgi:anti-anti-sigma factor
METASEFAGVLRSAAERSLRVAVDMSMVEFIDSSGIAVLLDAADRVRKDGGELTVRSPRAEARRVFGLLSLDGALPIEDQPAGGRPPDPAAGT